MRRKADLGLHYAEWEMAWSAAVWLSGLKDRPNAIPYVRADIADEVLAELKNVAQMGYVADARHVRQMWGVIAKAEEGTK